MAKRRPRQRKAENESSLRTLREEAGLTQEELAVRINVASSTIRRWETQGTEPSMTVLQMRNFCKAVGKTFDELHFFDVSLCDRPGNILLKTYLRGELILLMSYCNKSK